MKRTLVFVLVGVCSLCMARAVWAAGYFSANVGLVALEDSSVNDPALAASGISDAEISFDNGLGLTMAVGADAGFLRLEGEASYRKNDMDTLSANVNLPPVVHAEGSIDGEIEALTLMGNIYADIKTGSAVTPFVGMGIGISKLDGELEGQSEDDTVFAYQFILGTGVEVASNVDIDFSYRYFATSDPEFDTTEMEYASHNVMLGARFSF